MVLFEVCALLALLSAVHVLLGRYFPYFWRDARFLSALLRYGLRLERFKHTSSVTTVLDRFVQQARRVPLKAFVLYDGGVLTYRDVDQRSNRLANVFLRTVRVRTGDTVAILMNNEPDFLCVWFGLSKVGCSVAFLNTNLRSGSLLHCFRSCGAKTLIVGAGLVDSLDGIWSSLQVDDVQVWAMTDRCGHSQGNVLSDHVDAASERDVPSHLRTITSLTTPNLYIFTSGTTGLPKAAVITHLQTLRAAGGLWALGAMEDDVIYVPLPLYHSAASLVGIGGTVELGEVIRTENVTEVRGATCVLKKKFSASQFWSDCRKHNVTVFQYIGELCRYLCHLPQTHLDKVHKVRMGVGNGLRPDVWQEFQCRYGNIKMCEVYGSTEGNLCFMNHIGKIGSVGRSNFFYRLLFKYDLVKYDTLKDEPIRDQDGFCVRVIKGETGLLLSKVSALSPFFGYAGSRRLTERKLLRGVFSTGDAYFNTGDLMAEDRDGFIYFRDRVGDTFRWKGENVATTEVAEILGQVTFIQEVNVYGVQVPGHEGRAGMAAVTIKPGLQFDGRKLFDHVTKNLPLYARPLFIRLQETMDMTSTFKQQKSRLVASGFDPSTVADSLFVLQPNAYVRLTRRLYDDIVCGRHKL